MTNPISQIYDPFAEIHKWMLEIIAEHNKQIDSAANLPNFPSQEVTDDLKRAISSYLSEAPFDVLASREHCLVFVNRLLSASDVFTHNYPSIPKNQRNKIEALKRSIRNVLDRSSHKDTEEEKLQEKIQYESLKSLLSQLKNSINEQQLKIEELSNQTQNAIQQNANIQKESNAIIKSISISADSLLKESLTKIQAQFNQTQSHLKTQEIEITKLVDTVSNKALTGGHLKYSERELEAANKFRGWAMAVMIAFSLAMIIKIISFTPDINSKVIATHLTVTLLTTFLVGYLVRQSAVHRTQHQKYQKTALDLAALNPYTSNMAPESKDAIKRSIAEKIFAPVDAATPPSTESYGSQEIIMKLIDKLEPTPLARKD